MSDDNDNDLETYIYRGNKGEKVPKTIGKLVVKEGVQELPEKLCYNCRCLQEVTLPNGLTKIGDWAFHWCEKLLEITICNKVQFIGDGAFGCCDELRKVNFDFATSSPHHQLKTIDARAFWDCTSLQRISPPSSVNTVGECAFRDCEALTEANLSTTGLTEISIQTFYNCILLQTVSLPKTLERIGDQAFFGCRGLVTMVVPLDHPKSIRIGRSTFSGCQLLANFALPKDSTAEEDSFSGCELLHERYGTDSSRIVAGLMDRFKNFPIQRLCYFQYGMSAQNLQECIEEQDDDLERSVVDRFRMSPFHILFSTSDPSMELLEALLHTLPNQMLKWRDATGNRPLDYLIHNWTDGTKSLLLRTLQNWMIDPMVTWGSMKWVNGMKQKAGVLLFEDGDTEQRVTLFNEVYSLFECYENLAATSILEMALWKWKLKSGRTTDGSKRQALDRDESRCLSGSNIVIPHVVSFLGIRRTSD